MSPEWQTSKDPAPLHSPPPGGPPLLGGQGAATGRRPNRCFKARQHKVAAPTARHENGIPNAANRDGQAKTVRPSHQFRRPVAVNRRPQERGDMRANRSHARPQRRCDMYVRGAASISQVSHTRYRPWPSPRGLVPLEITRLPRQTPPADTTNNRPTCRCRTCRCTPNFDARKGHTLTGK